MTRALGIDLGTTYSLVASVTDTGIRLYETEMGQRSTPSVVLIGPGPGPGPGAGEVVVGEEAKRSEAIQPERTFAFFKREMGVPDRDRTVDGQTWSPQALSAEVLRSLTSDVQRASGQLPTQAVITVPAYFGEAARRATIRAGEMADLEVLELIHEPTAAALAFGFGLGGREVTARTLLVYDLGGGTFDVSLVRIGAAEMSVIATDGDHELGGKDWDDALIEIVAERFNDRHGVDPRWDPVAVANLRERCEDAKRVLSKVPQTTVNVVTDGLSERIAVTREEFESMTAPLLARTETLLAQVVAEAGLPWSAIDATVLVGGSTRMPACSALVERISGRAATRGVDPDTAVASGAAMVAARHEADRSGLSGPRPAMDAFLNGATAGGHATGAKTTSSSGPGNDVATGMLSRMPTLRDVTAHALGFVVINADGDRYVNEVMIARNAAVPAVQTQVKRLERGTADLDIYVLQGHQERPLATESLGRYTFTDVPGGDDDRDVRISFMYDGDAMVTVGAAVNGRELPTPCHDRDDRDLSWTDEDPRDHNRSMLDVALAIDCSGSMSGNPLDEAKDACADFAGLLGALPGARVALVSFASGAQVECPLTETSADVQAAARRLGTYGSTDLAAGLSAAQGVFDRDEGRRVIVVATDGAPNDADSARAVAQQCQAHGIEIVTIGVSGADMGFLTAIATADQDSLFTNDMRGALHSIARSLAGGLTRKA